MDQIAVDEGGVQQFNFTTPVDFLYLKCLTRSSFFGVVGSNMTSCHGRERCAFYGGVFDGVCANALSSRWILGNLSVNGAFGVKSGLLTNLSEWMVMTSNDYITDSKAVSNWRVQDI
jgi:hypothetical protein